MNLNSSSPKPSFWLQSFWQDLQPTPGRLNKTLHIVLASVVLLPVLLVLQMPFASYGLYSVFVLIGESPSISLRTGVAASSVVGLAIAIEISVVVLTDNDPLARILSVVIVAFIAGLMVVSTNVPPLGWMLGFFYCVLIAFWENPRPADALVKNSLYLWATLSLSVCIAVAVEYALGARSPADLLIEQLSIRYRALQEMFSLYAQDASPEQRLDAEVRVSRIAAAGQLGMMGLYSQIVDRNLDAGILPIGTRTHITMLAELMDTSAAFGLSGEAHDDPEFRRRCARIAEECGSLVPTANPQREKLPEHGLQSTHTLLDRVEATIHSILAMPVDRGVVKNRELAVLPEKKVPFLIPGAMKDKDNITFALKISLCATLCYIAYHAIDWPGTSTSVTTVMVAGLTTTGAMKQRLTYRMVGAILGGLILGLGATAFLFPYMDSITSLAVLIAVIAFIGGWISGGPKFNYIGLQIMFAFYLVAFEGFSAPTELAPARDRCIGILIGILVMWLVFDQIWPVRTVTAMRRVLASILRSGAGLFALMDDVKQPDKRIEESDGLRDQLAKNISALRTMSEAVDYEFGSDHEQHIRSSELILQTSIAAAALYWNQVAYLHEEQDQDFAAEPGLTAMRRKMAERLNSMADSVDRKTALSPDDAASLVNPSLLTSEQFGEYTRNTTARFEDLQTLTSRLTAEA